MPAIVKDDKYLEQLGKMTRPIPGQSLTRDPANPAAFEQPPEFTNKKEATEEIFSNMIREEIYVPMIEAIGNGATVMEVTQNILMQGFRIGKWNPDMFMMLIEPTAYMIMGLSERAGVEYSIDRDETDQEVEGREMSVLQEKMDRVKDKVKGTPVKGVLPEEIEKKIEEAPLPASLLARSKEEPVNQEAIVETEQAQVETEQQEDSLLAKRV